MEIPQRILGKEKFIDDLTTWFSTVGKSNYDDQVTQLEHAIQSAVIASSQLENPYFTTSALLHDIGHLLLDEHSKHEDFLESDLKHEEAGADWLAQYFVLEVVNPVRLHVPAKKYLCGKEPDYWSGLSDASKRSLEKQGGPMLDPELRSFEDLNGYELAVNLRRIDDLSKVKGKKIPSMDTFKDQMIASLL